MPLAALGPLVAGTPRFERELARAENLFTERRYAPAREAFERLAAQRLAATRRNWCSFGWPSRTFSWGGLVHGP